MVLFRKIHELKVFDCSVLWRSRHNSDKIDEGFPCKPRVQEIICDCFCVPLAAKMQQTITYITDIIDCIFVSFQFISTKFICSTHAISKDINIFQLTLLLSFLPFPLPPPCESLISLPQFDDIRCCAILWWGNASIWKSYCYFQAPNFIETSDI